MCSLFCSLRLVFRGDISPVLSVGLPMSIQLGEPITPCFLRRSARYSSPDTQCFYTLRIIVISPPRLQNAHQSKKIHIFTFFKKHIHDSRFNISDISSSKNIKLQGVIHQYISYKMPNFQSFLMYGCGSMIFFLNIFFP